MPSGIRPPRDGVIPVPSAGRRWREDRKPSLQGSVVITRSQTGVQSKIWDIPIPFAQGKANSQI